METFYTIAVYVLFLAFVISVSLAIYSWRRGEVAGARSFFWFLIVICFWTFSTAISTVSGSAEAAQLWHGKIRYLSITTLPVTLIAFVLEYTGQTRLLKVKGLAGLLIIPMATLVIVWTAPQLFEFNAVYTQIGNFFIWETSQTGSWLWVHSGYSYLLVVVGSGLLVAYAVRSRYPYRQQALILLGGTLLPAFVSVMLSFRLISNPPPDSTVLSFALTGVIWWWALFRYQLFDLMPVARDAIIDSMDDLVLVIDNTNRLADANPSALRVLGKEAEEIIGKPIVEVFARWQDIVTQFLDTQETHAEISLGEGKQIYDLRLSPLERNDSQVGRLIVLRDISERKRIELERESLITELDAYAHTVAHDLKSPISSIMGYASMLEVIDDQTSEEKRRRYIERIMGSADKMVSIIDSLLLLAKIRETDQIVTDELDMAAIVAETRERLHQIIEDQGAEIILPDLWDSAQGNRLWVEEVWMNYISNGLKYGGSPPRITLGSDLRDGVVRYWVRDNGAGLSKEEQERLFVPFSRLTQSRIEGHGLGLSIVRRIIRRLGGEVGVESEKGKGSLFWFTLPQ